MKLNQNHLTSWLLNLILNVAIFLFIFLPLEIIAGSNPQTSEQKEQNIRYTNIDFRPGDAVQIYIFPDTTSFLHRIFSIDGEGNVFLPIWGKVKIINMTEEDFIKFIKKNFMEYLRSPNVQVRSLIRVSLLGGFNRPGLYYIDKSSTMWDLIRLANGPVEEKGISKMRWERGKKIIKSDLTLLFESGHSLSQIGLKSGDQIWVPLQGKPSFLEKASVILPYVAVAISSYTLYLTYELSRR
jgi:protein involved in polysaccharide export with SLBB domain